MARMADAFMKGFAFTDQMARNYRNDQILEEERARVKSEREGFNKGIGMYIQSKLGQEPNEHSYKVFQEALDDPLSAAEAVERFSDLQEKLDMGTPADQLEKAAVDYFNLPSVAGNRLQERFGANGLSGKLSGMYPAGGDGVFFEADLTTQDGKNYKAPLTVGKTAAGQPGSEQDEVQVYKLKDLMEYGTGAAVTSRAALEYLAQHGGTQGAIFAANYLNEQDKAKRVAMLEEFKYQRERADKLADKQSEQQFELTKLGKQHENAVALEGVKQKNADKDRRGEAGKTFDDLARIFGPQQAAKMVGNKYGKKEVSEYQRVQALDKVQEIIDLDGGVTDTNAPQVNAMLRSIGEPVYERVLDQPAKEGFLGMGSTKESFKWVPGTKVEGQEESFEYQGGDVDFPSLRTAVAQAESNGQNFDKKGNPVTSPKGAQYEMQTMPDTARDPGYGIKPAQLTGNPENDAKEFNRVGTEKLAKMVERYQGNVPLALAAYNWGEGNVDKWLKAGADPAKMPKETRDYIVKVTKNYGMIAPTKDGQGMLAGGPGMGAAGSQAPQQAAQPRKKINLAQFDTARKKPQGPVKDYEANVDIGVPTTDTGENSAPVNDMPIAERIGEAVGTGTRAVSMGGNAFGETAALQTDGAQQLGTGMADAALAARDFGESFGTTDRWKKIFAGLSDAAKASLQALKENGLSEAQIVAAAEEQKLPLEEFLVKFSKGYSKGKQNANS